MLLLGAGAQLRGGSPTMLARTSHFAAQKWVSGAQGIDGQALTAVEPHAVLRPLLPSTWPFHTSPVAGPCPWPVLAVCAREL